MNSNDKYIARCLFGNVSGMIFNKKNLLIATKNPTKYRIMSKSASLFSEKMITIRNEDQVDFSIVNQDGNTWNDFSLPPLEFWQRVKSRKAHFIIIENCKMD